MRELTDDEIRLLERARRLRRAADAMAVRNAALRGAATLAEDILAAVPDAGGRRLAALRVTLLRRQIVAVRGAQGLPLVQALLERAHRQALAALDLEDAQ